MSSEKTILIVDDEPSICWGFRKLFETAGHQVVTASSVEEAFPLVQRYRLALVLLDVRLPGMDGITALPEFLERSNFAPVIIMTAFGDLETAVGAVRRGATDYLIKPFRLEEAAEICNRALALSNTCTESDEEDHSSPSPANVVLSNRLVGRSAAMQQIFRQIALVSDSDLSVLITGETGTGKELVAAAIHQHSQRKNQPYLPVAPIALNADIIESELFGHTRGAFTGAAHDRAGVFEQAENGTVFLDEIGDLSLNLQVKLLRVLESGHYTRVGDVQPRHCNVRILAATNCDLLNAVHAGAFREDLYYRLNGMHIHLPPLRERKEDIPILCEYFLQQRNYPRAESAIAVELATELSEREWTGNIRELKNAVNHAAVLARGRALRKEDFPSPQKNPHNGSILNADIESMVIAWCDRQLTQMAPNGPTSSTLHATFLQSFEQPLLKRLIEYTGGNKAKAAELLGIHRATLRERLKTYADASEQPHQA